MGALEILFYYYYYSCFESCTMGGGGVYNGGGVSRECPPVSDHLDHDMTNNWNTPQQKPDKRIFIVHHLTLVA